MISFHTQAGSWKLPHKTELVVTWEFQSIIKIQHVKERDSSPNISNLHTTLNSPYYTSKHIHLFCGLIIFILFLYITLIQDSHLWRLIHTSRSPVSLCMRHGLRNWIPPSDGSWSGPTRGLLGCASAVSWVWFDDETDSNKCTGIKTKEQRKGKEKIFNAKCKAAKIQ